MKIWLDDLRPMPFKNGIPEYTFLCKTASEAIELLSTGCITFISFDHDLGDVQTGYTVACYIEQQVYNGKIPMPDWEIHSANPVGRKNIKRAMESAERFTKRTS